MVLLMFAVSLSSVYGTGTTYNTTISNYVEVSGANFSALNDNVTTNVQRIAGGHWAGEADIPGVSAGETVTNTTYLTNLGNDAFTFAIGITNSQNSSDTGPWSWTIYTQGNFTTAAATGSSNKLNAFTLTISENASKRIDLVVTVDIAASSGSQSWVLIAYDNGTHQNQDNYTGDNNIQYGGPAGEGWGDTISDALVCYEPSPGDHNWTVTVSGPNIAITKSIQSITTSSPDGPDNVAIPGATIVFRVYVTNSGNGAANNVVVKDYLYTNYVVYDGRTQPAGWTFSSNISGNPWVLQWSNSSLNANSAVTFTINAIIK